MPSVTPFIKRSASEQFEESPAKRVNITGKLNPDLGSDRGNFTSQHKLIPVISRAETAQFQDCTRDNTGKQDENSDDEFVDAHEHVGGQGGFLDSAAAAAADIELTAAQFVGNEVQAKSEAEESTLQEMMENEEMTDSNASKQSQKIEKAEAAETTEEIPGDNRSKAEHQTEDHQKEEEEEESPASVSSEDEDSSPEPFEDIFASTFGARKPKSESTLNTSNTLICTDPNTTFSSNNLNNKLFTSGLHATTIHHYSSNDKSLHPSTPPSTPSPPTTTTNNLSTTTISRQAQPPPRRRPDIVRDLSLPLIHHEKFHTLTRNLISRLPNHENYNWTRRYWIAVLIQGKKSRKRSNLSESDFVWMKGNRFSTVSTVFHSYALAVMANPEDLALILGSEKVEMEDQMQELDYFSDRLVVFRAVKVQGNAREAEGRSLVKGVVPEEAIISLDLD